ncbi:MAG: Holliday junction resolvase RuvX [Phycisphaeraceae bacterium]|nr:MAG: Holliday junction resolvase RuvX [Phycisphaeraceae bacterium]
MRFLAIDLGDKRTGLAHGDDESGLVSPGRQIEKPINPGAELLDAIANAIDDYGPDALVVGLPLNMDGTEGPRAKLVRAFAARISERTNLPIHFQDERLTTASADWTMARSGMTRKQKKARRDALAAAAILRDFLDQRSSMDEEE